MLAGLDAAARAFVEALQPFATGEGRESPLWHLSKLSNWDKHRSISVAVVASQNAGAEVNVSCGSSPVVFTTVTLDDNSPLYGATIPDGDAPIEERAAKVQYKGDAILFFAFKEPDTARGLQVELVLNTIGKSVAQIARQVENGYFKR
jgi:hypothetical protein